MPLAEQLLEIDPGDDLLERAALQPVAVEGVALVLGALALSMFGAFELRLPSSLPTFWETLSFAGAPTCYPRSRV